MGPSLYRWYGMGMLYVLGVLLNWLGCFMLGVARSEGLAGSWLADVKVRLKVITYHLSLSRLDVLFGWRGEEERLHVAPLDVGAHVAPLDGMQHTG
jgi:hypothetical protein